MRVFLGIKQGVYTPSLERAIARGENKIEDRTEGALAKFYVYNQNQEVEEVVVDIPTPPETMSELTAISIALVRFNTGIHVGGYSSPDEIRWVEMATELS